MNIFYGAYGIDLLSIFLLIISFFLGFNYYTNFLGLILNIFVIYRTFSKNIFKRTNELNKFLSIINKILSKFNKSIPYNLPRMTLDHIPQAFNMLKYKLNQKRKFKIISCPRCGQKLRLPRIHKNVIVTCKKCSNEFKTKA